MSNWRSRYEAQGSELNARTLLWEGFLLAVNSTFQLIGVLIRSSILKVSTFISLGFGPVSFRV